MECALTRPTLGAQACLSRPVLLLMMALRTPLLPPLLEEVAGVVLLPKVLVAPPTRAALALAAMAVATLPESEPEPEPEPEPPHD